MSQAALRELLIVNAPFLLPLLVLSVISTAVILERSLYLWQGRMKTPQLMEKLIALLRMGSIEKVIDLLSREKGPEAALMQSAFYYVQEQGPVTLKLVIEGMALREARKLEDRLPLLHTVANVATLLGLLGTVTGMIITFYQGVQSGFSSPLPLINGISQALISTACGLIVAIPASLAGHTLSDKVYARVQNMDILCRETSAFLEQPL